MKARFKPCLAAQNCFFPADYRCTCGGMCRNETGGEIAAADILGKCSGDIGMDSISQFGRQGNGV
ncbi:hypothetical protein TPL01_27880 [Sulfuriferula plumbiphila]|uniref:Uncharacterized protein n=1 Tax=Sulfuriferula plumbiphila TaxID=171865 RepID=A0A512LAY4_9PROT|nr:hypothetical protein SFPGR_13490 [Sulfuriferula plumbiphila]GEP31650.1 hypothetical protein TPL01_27880 [Sulfuriferula plumbiphila]